MNYEDAVEAGWDGREETYESFLDEQVSEYDERYEERCWNRWLSDTAGHYNWEEEEIEVRLSALNEAAKIRRELNKSA